VGSIPEDRHIVPRASEDLVVALGRLGAALLNPVEEEDLHLDALLDLPDHDAA
jgi:hypothetical protein